MLTLIIVAVEYKAIDFETQKGHLSQPEADLKEDFFLVYSLNTEKEVEGRAKIQ